MRKIILLIILIIAVVMSIAYFYFIANADLPLWAKFLLL